MLGATLVQWPAWVLGTAVGALLVPSADVMYRFGLDVIFPCFFLILLLDALRSRPDHRWIALAAALISGVAVLVLPVGVALILSSAAVLLTLRPLTRTSS
jgi:predicted branched-subunit amino acid permease